jgi:Na+-transporting methylmalonyl-CoA/oxaloacetate decarboxylase gamma subunit
MNEGLVVAIQITVIGMGLVFLAILLLWGLIVILVRSTRPANRTRVEEIEPDPEEMVRLQRAAAAAVAVALARMDEGTELHVFPLPPAALISAWQAVKRGQTFSTKKGPTK